ncbi:hypothetical protein [Alteribacillus sp. HJP-4]|uniref:hypothetical protein n=1 Tax=Alteribacillus sp. HJP-4 TaxID=2775394 RepID=UPI0035CD1A38
MVWTLVPWLFHLLLSIFIIATVFCAGLLLHNFLKKKGRDGRRTETMLAFGLAIMMACFYFIVTENFTDSASQGEKIVTQSGTEEVEASQAVVIPIGNYVIIERLYEFGYTVEKEAGSGTYRYTFLPENWNALLENYSSYISGDGLFSNNSRFQFARAAEEEWVPRVEGLSPAEAESALPGLTVTIEEIDQQ